MRKAVGRKLHSQTGASLLIALLYFLAAITVGAVALTAASTNAGRLVRNRQEQQDYLAVASAALLVKEDLRGTTLTVGYKRVITITTRTYVDPATGESQTQTSTSTDDSRTPAALTGGSELLRDRPKDDLAQLYYGTVAVLHEPAPGEMKYPLEIKAENLPTVSGTMRVETEETEKARYTITVELYIEEDGTRTNAITLLFTPTVRNTQSTGREYGADTETVTTTCTTAVTWDAPVITKGAAA